MMMLHAKFTNAQGRFFGQMKIVTPPTITETQSGWTLLRVIGANDGGDATLFALVEGNEFKVIEDSKIIWTWPRQ